MPRLPVTLLCSAAATGLTAISRTLNETRGITVIDLEETLKREIYPWDGRGDDEKTMAAVCAENDRDTVLGYWHEALERSIYLASESSSEHIAKSCASATASPHE